MSKALTVHVVVQRPDQLGGHGVDIVHRTAGRQRGVRTLARLGTLGTIDYCVGYAWRKIEQLQAEYPGFNEYEVRVYHEGGANCEG